MSNTLESSLRSASLRSAAGKTVGEAEEIPLFFKLISFLALLSNYDQENCLTNLGTEGPLWFTNTSVHRVFPLMSFPLYVPLSLLL